MCDPAGPRDLLAGGEVSKWFRVSFAGFQGRSGTALVSCCRTSQVRTTLTHANTHCYYRAHKAAHSEEYTSSQRRTQQSLLRYYGTTVVITVSVFGAYDLQQDGESMCVQAYPQK